MTNRKLLKKNDVMSRGYLHCTVYGQFAVLFYFVIGGISINVVGLY